MIHYHGTPIGGDASVAMQFLTGRHALVSFVYPSQLHIIRECSASFIVDNGAFTAWKQGIELDRAGYVDFVRECHASPRFDWAIIPDVIDGAEAENDRLIDEWPSDVRGYPVWHLHESLERAERLSRSFNVVCLGSSGKFAAIGTDEWWQRMDEARDAFCSNGIPRCKLHGLRMLDPAIFSWLPLASGDSTNVGRNNARNGTAFDAKFSRLQGAILTAWRIERHNSSETWIKRNLRRSQPQLFDTSGGDDGMGDSLLPIVHGKAGTT